MPANRCSTCGINWPQAVAFKTCPSCAEKTDGLNNVECLPLLEARELKADFEFERGIRGGYDEDTVQASIDERFTLAAWKAEARLGEFTRHAAISPSAPRTRKGSGGASA